MFAVQICLHSFNLGGHYATFTWIPQYRFTKTKQHTQNLNYFSYELQLPTGAAGAETRRYGRLGNGWHRLILKAQKLGPHF